MNKLGIGTVQFGCPYGISNKQGQVPEEEVARILRTAREHGLNTLDTASLYGNAEEVLSHADLSGFRLVTKTTKLDTALSREENTQRFRQGFENSLRLLAPHGQLYGCLFHEANDLLGEDGNALWEAMESYKKEGRLQKIGVSVYTPAQLMQVIERYAIDLVQFPLNLLDQRFLPLIAELKAAHVEIHVRSAFLQGLLLMPQEEISPWFNEIKPILARIPGENRLRTALDFVLSVQGVDRVIVGVTTHQELEEILRAAQAPRSGTNYTSLAIEDEKYTLPFNWER